jgi:hypothetical protein
LLHELVLPVSIFWVKICQQVTQFSEKGKFRLKFFFSENKSAKRDRKLVVGGGGACHHMYV